MAQMEKNNHKSFLSILDELSGGRMKTPWLQDIGLTKGTISRLINGDQPSLDILTALARTENASLHWLTDKRGTPFRVNRVANDSDGRLLLDELLQENGWTGYQFTDGYGRNCLVLTQPGEFEIKGRSVPYHIVEIMAGDIGSKTLERITQAVIDGLPLYISEISQNEFDRLSTGYMGNYELLGWREEHGLIHTASPGDARSITQVNEQQTDYKPSNDTEKRLLENFRRLSPKAQQQLLDIAKTLGQA